jgi:hypothetical protein
MDSLPVLCYAKESGWLTSEIFKKWLMSWYVELQRKSREILLVLDNCTAHLIRLFEKHPNGISLSQHHISGTANGHANHRKTLYRAKLVSYILLNPLRATSYIWGSCLIGAKYSSPDVPQSTEIYCIPSQQLPEYFCGNIITYIIKLLPDL